jgi:uncharacterized protein YjiK
LDISSKNVNKIETPLNSKNDIEGLAYDKISNQLILACKGSSDIGDNDNKGKGFYRFDLTNRRLDENPWLVLPNKKIQKFIKSKGGKRKVSEFKPSGVAIHPITNEVYILAHGGKWLVTLSQSMEVSAVYSLKHKLFGQPEGICFTPSGDLLISNEGQGDRGTLLFYKYQK